MERTTALNKCMRPFAKFLCGLLATNTVEMNFVYFPDVVYDTQQAELIENTKEIASGRGNKEG